MSVKKVKKQGINRENWRKWIISQREFFDGLRDDERALEDFLESSQETLEEYLFYEISYLIHVVKSQLIEELSREKLSSDELIDMYYKTLNYVLVLAGKREEK